METLQRYNNTILNNSKQERAVLEPMEDFSDVLVGNTIFINQFLKTYYEKEDQQFLLVNYDELRDFNLFIIENYLIIRSITNLKDRVLILVEFKTNIDNTGVREIE